MKAGNMDAALHVHAAGHVHGHAHGHDHSHDDGHDHAAHAAGSSLLIPKPAPAPVSSLLMASALLRFAGAIGLIALLWMAVVWAMSGTA